MSAPPRLVRKEFREWLAGKKPQQVVGVSRNLCRCPIARFLNSKTGAPAFVCDSDYQVADSDYGPLPQWAEAFANSVDASGLDARITAATALRILDSVK